MITLPYCGPPAENPLPRNAADLRDFLRKRQHPAQSPQVGRSGVRACGRRVFDGASLGTFARKTSNNLEVL